MVSIRVFCSKRELAAQPKEQIAFSRIRQKGPTGALRPILRPNGNTPTGAPLKPYFHFVPCLHIAKPFYAADLLGRLRQPEPRQSQEVHRHAEAWWDQAHRQIRSTRSQ